MYELPLWPPLAALAFGVTGGIFFWLWSRRLDREDEARRHRPPAE